MDEETHFPPKWWDPSELKIQELKSKGIRIVNPRRVAKVLSWNPNLLKHGTIPLKDLPGTEKEIINWIPPLGRNDRALEELIEEFVRQREEKLLTGETEGDRVETEERGENDIQDPRDQSSRDSDPAE